MFSFDNVHTVSVVVSDPGADAIIPVFKVPSRLTKIEILEAWASIDTALAGSGTGVILELVDYGSTGTVNAGTLCSALGGTATGNWTANVPKAFTVADSTHDGGDYVMLKYNEQGTVAPKNITVQISYVSGVGA